MLYHTDMVDYMAVDWNRDDVVVVWWWQYYGDEYEDKGLSVLFCMGEKMRNWKDGVGCGALNLLG